MTDLALFWHRRDLRTSDNVGLSAAVQRWPRVVGVFCLDAALLQPEEVAAVRVAYLLGCLQALQAQYAQLGSQLLVLKGQPEQAISQLATQLQAGSVYWNLDVEPYAQTRDRKVEETLKEAGIPTQTFWDQLLHAPDAIQTTSQQPYTVYTPFWRNWSSRPKASPLPDLEHLTGLTAEELAQAKSTGIVAIPSLKDLGFPPVDALFLEPGPAPALAQLETFTQGSITNYQEQRNLPSLVGTSQLSPALKFGAIGIRTVWAATLTALEDVRSDEVRASIQTWQQELAWREFYQQAMYHFPELAEGPYRRQWNYFPWENNLDQFQAWCAGQTGYPIVDAAMRQLNQTGWMHNRCRMIVASFLTKDLIINWQWGERYFMQKLIDGDLSANNGGWQWSASSGMDPKPLRIFNPTTQTQKFDPEGDYIRQWVPELRSADTADLVTGKLSPLDCHQLGYPSPIVDHNQQQRSFKARYQLLKESP